MGVPVHRQCDGAVTGQFLRILRGDSGFDQFRDEPVPQAVEVRDPSFTVAVGEEV